MKRLLSMLKMKSKTLLISLMIIFEYLTFSVYADLPVHCLKHDITGTWTIHATKLRSVPSGHEMKCGHQEPSSELNANTAKSPYTFEDIYSIELTPKYSKLVFNNRTETGNWTMVYDEGFNIDFQDLTFFAFSKYEKIQDGSKEIYNSKCYSTCVGWFATRDSSQWGCFIAMKQFVDPETIVSSDLKNDLQIVQPSSDKINQASQKPAAIETLPITSEEISTKLLSGKFLNSTEIKSDKKPEDRAESKNIEVFKNQFNDISKKIEMIDKLERDLESSEVKSLEELPFRPDSKLIPKEKEKLLSQNAEVEQGKLLQESTSYVEDRETSTQDNLQNKMKLSSFLNLREEMTTQLKLTASFSNHMLYIRRLNRIKKSWTADIHPEFKHMSIMDLNRFAGIPKLFNHFRFKSNDNAMQLGKRKKFSEDVSMLPQNFDWKEKLRPAGSQGNCGSCYAYSSTRMAEARLQIAYNHSEVLSVQHSLDCSFYNQGCSGGYPFLVMKFASQFEMIPEYCKPYIEMDSKCSDECDKSKLPLIYQLKEYKYVGGSYGDCSEKAIMEEVLVHGPIVVSFEPDYNFMMYKTGIYHSLGDTNWISAGVSKPEWQKVDHSVLLVGWGVDKTTNEKYWIIQNTWGPNWGEDGFFRMLRGVDELGIESICESAHPVIIENKTKKAMNPSEFNTFKQQSLTENHPEVLHESIFEFLKQ